MKQILTVFFCLLASITGYAENKIKMVTYFPVPYVAYSKVNVTDQMDIGLTTSCIMNLGCTESGNAGLRPLNVTNTILNKGKLELNTATAVSGSTASIGSGSGSGSMNFNSNLRVNTLNDGVSVEANNITVDTLKLFPNRITTDFPNCASTGAPGTPNISWQKLKLKDKEEVYLMCGESKNAIMDCPTSSKPATSQSCNGCGTQTRSVTCDTSTGQWQTGAWGTCVGGNPSQTTQEESCTASAYYYYNSMSDSPSTRIGPVSLRGKRTRSWNSRTCSWGSWSKCSGAIYVSLGSFTKASNKSYCSRGSSSICNQGSNGLNSSCSWPQSSGLYGQYCVSPYGSGCYIYQCQTIYGN